MQQLIFSIITSGHRKKWYFQSTPKKTAKKTASRIQELTESQRLTGGKTAIPSLSRDKNLKNLNKNRKNLNKTASRIQALTESQRLTGGKNLKKNIQR